MFPTMKKRILYWLPEWWPYAGMALSVAIIVRRGHYPSARLIRHEEIHLAQQRELWHVGFYLIYMVEFLCRLVAARFRWDKAYRGISFEREAYRHDANPGYLATRPPHAWKHYFFNRHN